MPPNTTGPYQSGVRPTHASPRRSWRSSVEELVDRGLLLLGAVGHLSARGTRARASP